MPQAQPPFHSSSKRLQLLSYWLLLLTFVQRGAGFEIGQLAADNHLERNAATHFTTNTFEQSPLPKTWLRQVTKEPPQNGMHQVHREKPWSELMG